MEARFAPAPQAACPARSSSGKCPGEAPGPARASGTERSVRRWGWTPIAPDGAPCTPRQRPPSSANPLQAYQSTVWPNRDGLLGLRRPPSSLNRLYTRPRGPAPGRSYRLAVLYLGRRRHCLRTVPAAESESTVTTPTVTNWQRPQFPTRTLTLPLFPGLAWPRWSASPQPPKTKPSPAWPGDSLFDSLPLSCLHDSTDLLNFLFSSSLVVQLPRLRGENEGKSSID